MLKPFDKNITIQRIDETTEDWNDLYTLHARVNKKNKDVENTTAGAERSNRSLTFEVRYFKDLENIAYNTQLYRVVYNGRPFNITDYDDFMESHKTVRLEGVSY